MQLINASTGESICSPVVCKGLLSKAKGLMFSKPKPLLFVFAKEARHSLHMFFVFYPIDVVLLSKEMQVVEIKKNFRPFTWYAPKAKSKYILELPTGYADSVKLGDTLKKRTL